MTRESPAAEAALAALAALRTDHPDAIHNVFGILAGCYPTILGLAVDEARKMWEDG